MSNRFKTGSVARDNRSKVWCFYWRENGKRRCKTLGRFPTKALAWQAAKPLRDALETKPQVKPIAPTVSTLIAQYRLEKMPTRHDTRGGYESWLRVYIIPKWGEYPITEVQARPVELWLDSLPLAPKSKVHVRGILRSLWNYAMWKQDIPCRSTPSRWLQ